MKTRTLLLLCVAMLLCAGCTDTSWYERHEPMTDAERQAVAEHAKQILEATPRSLAGDDQDWDDAIQMAHVEAKRTLCRKTYWEWKSQFPDAGAFTGRWRYADEAEIRGGEAK